jgi:hypothetical protein
MTFNGPFFVFVFPDAFFYKGAQAKLEAFAP